MPKVSVIIVTYNREKYLKSAIKSVLNQNFQDFELIIVDDGSTDETKKLIEEIPSSKIKYYYKPHTNAPDSRNYGINKASGEFIVWLDSDDILMPNSLELELNQFQEEPNLDIVYGDFISIDEQAKEIGVIKHYEYPTKGLLIEALVWDNPFPNPGTMIRKKCYDEVGNFDPSFTRAHDYEFWSRALRKCEVKHINAFVCKWRKHELRLSGPHRDKSFNVKVLKKILERYSLQELFPWIDWQYQEPQVAQAKACLTVGKLFSYREADDEAMKYFQSSLEHCPLSEAYFRLAKINQKKGKVSEAKTCLNKALELNPGYQQAREALWMIERKYVFLFFDKIVKKVQFFTAPKRNKKTVFFIIGYFAELGGAEGQFVSLILNRKSAGYNPLVFSFASISPNNRYILRLKEAGIRVIAPWEIFTKITRFFKIFIVKISNLFIPLYALFKKLSSKQAGEKLQNELDFEFKHRIENPINDFVFYLILSWKDLFNRAALVHSFRCDFGTRLAVTWARRHGVPMIYSERGGVDREDYYQKPWFYSSKKIKEIGRYCTIIVQSRRIRQRAWKVFGPESKIAAIPNCISDFKIPPSKPRMQFTIGSSGRLSHEKGYNILLRAIKIISEKNIGIQCLIAGEGVERENLIRAAKNYDIIDNISLIGTIKEADIPVLLSEIDAFVLPSRTEGMPTSLLQAMAAGKPSVATKVGAVPEVASNGGVALVEKDNPEELAKAIISFYENKQLRQKMGEESRKNYLENYSPDVVWTKWDEIYNRILKK